MMIWQPDKVIVSDGRVCRYCGKSLTGTYRRSVCDSSKCIAKSRHDDYIKHIEKYRIRNKHYRTKYPHICPTCKKHFNGDKNQVFCSRRCAKLKLHIYHNRIEELYNQGYSISAIANDINESTPAVSYYCKKYVMESNNIKNDVENNNDMHEV